MFQMQNQAFLAFQAFSRPSGRKEGISSGLKFNSPPRLVPSISNKIGGRHLRETMKHLVQMRMNKSVQQSVGRHDRHVRGGQSVGQ